MADRFYNDINDLIRYSGKDIAKSLQGDYKDLVVKEGATKDQVSARFEAVDLGAKAKSIKSQILSMQQELDKLNYGFRFDVDKSSGRIRALIIPKSDNNFLSTAISEQDIAKYIKLDFQVDIGGTVDKAGLKGKNHLIFDSNEGKILGYTFVEQQLEEEIDFLKSSRGRELLAKANPASKDGAKVIEEINSLVRKRGASALEKMALAGDSPQSTTGTASKMNQAMMSGIIEAEKLFEKAYRDNRQMLSHGRQRGQTATAYREMIKKEAYIASYLLSQGVPLNKITTDPRFEHIALSTGFMKTLQNFSRLGLNMGFTGEDAATNYQFTQLPQSVTTGGLFDEKSSRKRRQITNILNPSLSLEERKKLGAKRGASLTKFEKKSGVSLDSAENATFGVRYVSRDLYAKAVKKTEEELSKKYGREIKIREGIDSDAGIYASSLSAAFNGTRVTPSKFSQKDYQKIYSSLAQNNTKNLTEDQLQEEALRTLIRDKYGLASDWNGKIIRKDIDPNSNFVKVDFEEPRNMKSGNKLLGKHANVRATFQELEDEIFNLLRRNLGLDKETQLILGENKIGGKMVSGVIAETLEGIAEKANTNGADLKDILSKSKILSRFYTADKDDSGNWVLRYKTSIDELDKAIKKIEDENGFRDFFKEVNNVAQEAYNTTKDFFKILKDGSVQRTKDWKGRSAYNQIDQYEYGAPEGTYTSFGRKDNRVVSLDYRGRGAIEREIGLLEASTGKGHTAFKTFMRGVTAVPQEDLKRLEDLKRSNSESIQKTKETARSDFDINKLQNATVVGWGKKPDDLGQNVDWINLEAYEEADKELSKHMDANGFYSAKDFENTSWAMIKTAQELGPVYFRHGMGMVGYEDQYGNKILGTNNYVNLADLQVETEEEKDSTGKTVTTGYKMNENLKKAMSRMKYQTNRAVETGYTDEIEYGEDSILEYLTEIYNDVNSKEGTTWQRGNKSRVRHSMFAKVNAADTSRYEELADKTNRTGAEDLELRLMTSLETGNIEDVKKLLGFANKEEAANPMAKFEALMLKYQKLYNFESEQDTQQRFLDDINKYYNSDEAKKKARADAKAHYDQNKKDIWDFYRDPDTGTVIGNATSVFDEESQSWIDFNSPEEKRDYFLDIQDKLLQESYDEIENRKRFNSFEDIGKLTKNGQIKGVVNFLIDQIIGAVTLDSDALNERIDKAHAMGKKLHGLIEILKRYPESGGTDEKFVEMFVDSKLSRGMSRLGIGIGQSFNADNDGDRVARYMALADSQQMAKILKAKDKKAVVDSMYDAADMFEKISSVIGERIMRVKAAERKDVGKIKPKEWESLLDPTTQVITTVASRINKSKTGLLSNEYQSVAEAMSYFGIDEKGLGKDLSSQKKAAGAALTRALFESFTQDAISSKKVADRITDINGEGWTNENSKFFKELDDLVKDLSDPSKYKDIKGLIESIQKIGIIGGKTDKGEAVFNDRIESSVLALINRMSKSKEVFRDIFGGGKAGEDILLKATGKTSFKDINRDDIDKAIAKGSLHLTADQLIAQLQQVNESLSLSGQGSIGDVIRGRKWVVPGLLNATTNPVGMLGEKVGDLGAPYDDLKDKINGVEKAVDSERAAEEAKIAILKKEKTAIGDTKEAYRGLGDVLEKIAEQHHKTIDQLTDDDIKDAYSRVKGLGWPMSASTARKEMLPAELRTSYPAGPIVEEKKLDKLIEFRDQKRKKDPAYKLTVDDIGKQLGFRNRGDVFAFMSSYSAFNRGHFVGNVTQLKTELDKAGIKNLNKSDNETDEEYIKRLDGLASDFVKDYDKYKAGKTSKIDSKRLSYFNTMDPATAKVIRGYITHESDEHGQYTDIKAVFEKAKKVEALFSDIDDSFNVSGLIKVTENIMTLMRRLGMTGQNLIGTEFGAAGIVGGRPYATTADIVSSEYVEKDGKKYRRAVVSDIKSHTDDKFVREDANQVALEQLGWIKLIEDYEEKSDKNPSLDFKIFEEGQRAILRRRYETMGMDSQKIDEVLAAIKLFSKADFDDFVKTKKAGIDPVSGRLIISNKNTQNATAYTMTGMSGEIRKAISDAMDKDSSLTEATSDMIMNAFAFTGTTDKYGNKKALTKQEEKYVELLDEELKLKKEFKTWQEKNSSQKGSQDYDVVLKSKREEIALANKATEEAAKKAHLDPKNNKFLNERNAAENLENQRLIDQENQEKADQKAKAQDKLEKEREKEKKSKLDSSAIEYREAIQARNSSQLRIEKLKTDQYGANSVAEFNAIQQQIQDEENHLKQLVADVTKTQRVYTRRLNLNRTGTKTSAEIEEKSFIDEQNRIFETNKLKEETERSKTGYTDLSIKQNELKAKEDEAAKSRYIDLLQKEYSIRLEIEKLKLRQSKSTDPNEISNLKTLIDYNEQLANAKKAEVDAAAQMAGLNPNQNGILDAQKAEHGLRLKQLLEGSTPKKRSLKSSLGYDSEGILRTITQYFSLYRVMGKIRQMFQKVITISKELDKSITNIRIVTGQNREEIDNAVLSYSVLAKELGTTTTALAQSANQWLRQGYSVSESMNLIKATTQLSKLGMLDMSSATKVLTSTLKGFKMEASEAGKIVDKLTKLDMNYAASAGEIGEAMSRTAAIASQMGMSLDETAAMVTTIMDVTQQSSEMAGTAVRSILARYGNVKSGSFISMMTEGEDLEKINDIEKVLNVLGITIRTSKMEMRDMGDVLDELALKWNTLSSVEQNAVATAFAGTRQRNAFQTLLSNWSEVREAQDIAANSAGTAEEKYKAYMDSIEASVNKVTNAWENLTQRMGANKAIKDFFKLTAFLVKNLDKIVASVSTIFMAKHSTQLLSFIPGLGSKLGGAGVAGVGAQTNVTKRGFTTVKRQLNQIIALLSGKTVGAGSQITEPGFFNIGNRFKTNHQNRIAIKTLRNNPPILADGYDLYGQQVADENMMREAREAEDRLKNQEITQRTNQNRFNRRWGLGLGYTTKDANDNPIYATHSHGEWIDNKGEKITNQNQINSLNALRRQKILGKVGMGAVAGLTAGIQGFMTGPTDTFGITKGLFKTKDVGVNDIQSDNSDKFINGAMTGIATGALTAIGGPLLGGILGPIIGDGIGSIIKFWRHRDEIERKQRVEDAKKNLEALNKIETATKGVQSAVFDLTTATAVAEAKKSVDELINTILDDSKNREGILEKLKSDKNLGINSISDLEKVLLGDDDEKKAKALDIINNYTNSNQASETAKSQEEDRYKANKDFKKKVNAAGGDVTWDAYNLITNKNKNLSKYFNSEVQYDANYQQFYTTSLIGATLEEQVKNAEAAAKEMRNILSNGTKLNSEEKKYLQDEIKKLDAVVKQYSDFQATNEKLNRQLWNDELSAAFSDAGLSLWDTVDVANASLEEVVQKFAKNLSLTGQATRDYSGVITDTARQQIETFLRSNEKFSALFNGSTKTFNDLLATEKKQADLVAETGADSYEALRDVFDRNDVENMKKIANDTYKLGYDLTKELEETQIKKLEESIEKLSKQIYKLDNSELEKFAKALHMTTDETKLFQEQLGSITLADLLKSPAELRDSFDDLLKIFTEMSTKGSLSGELLEKLNEQYFSLYNAYDESGNIISTGSNNLLSNLRQRLFGSANDRSTQAFLYQNATFEQLRDNSSFYTGLKSEIDRRIKSGELDVNKEGRDKISGAKTLNDVIDYIGNNDDLTKVLREYLDSLNMQNSYYQELQDKLVEWQKHENTTMINNLQGQIDALDKINEEREKEINLIKAKDALENAKNEKKRVYRAGVGWTYEADSQAITEAQENLDKIELDNDKENLQYQIDLLEQQNSILDNISQNEQLEALKNVFDEYNKYMQENFGDKVTGGLSSILKFIGNTDGPMTWSQYIEMMGKEKDEEKNATSNSYTNAMDDIVYQYQVMKDLESEAKTDDDLTKIRHSKEYIAAQEAANASYSQMLSAESELKRQGVDLDQYETLKERFINKGVLNGRYRTVDTTMGNIIKSLENNRSNERYYYADYGFNEKGNQVDKDGIELKVQGSYTDDDISRFVEQYYAGASGIKIHRLNNDGTYDEISRLEELKDGDVAHLAWKGKRSKAHDSVNEYVIKDGSTWRPMKATPLANGTCGVKKDTTALINEVGLEGIITPQGTITSLPAKTGVLPADLTKNLYNLGEVAPNLIKRFDENINLDKNNNINNTEDNSMSIGNFNATFNTIDNYDFEQLLVRARQYMLQTKNKRG